MLADLWDITIIATMALVALVPIMVAVRFGVWTWATGQQIYIAWEQWCIDRMRLRADATLVTLQPGEVKISRNELSDVVRAQIELTAQRTDALRLPANVPHTLHYAPNIRQIDAPRVEPAAEPVLPALVVPSFRELFRSGVLRPDQLLLGYHEHTGRPHYGALRDVYSSLIIAKSGGGKTTLERFLLAQACMMGARFAVIDPHGRTAEGLAVALRPLSAHQMFEPAIDDAPIEQAMHVFLKLVENRVNKVDTSEDVRILAVDEVNMLIDDLGNGFATDLTRLAERGRKVGVFVFAAGQSAEASRTGGTAEMRKAFVGRYVLRADKDAVGRLIPDRDLLNMVPLLEPGHAIFVPTRSEPVPLAIPDTTEADLVSCFGSPVVEPVPSPVISPVPPAVPQLTHEPLNWVDTGSRAELVRQLFLSGKSQTEIIAEVWGVSQKGRAWQQAAQELNNVLRSLLHQTTARTA